MRARTILSRIQRVTMYLLENELAIASNSSILRNPGKSEYVIWSGAPEKISEIYHPQFASIMEYYDALQKGNYNILLFDGSIIQFIYIVEGSEVIWHRLQYYPCPLVIPVEEIDELSLDRDFIALFQLFFEEDLSKIYESVGTSTFLTGPYHIRSLSPMRFDYSKKSAKKHRFHPQSHMHFNISDCRLPLLGPLSIGHFVRFIFRSFYPGLHEDFPELHNWPTDQMTRTITREETRSLYLDAL